ncbi:MAG: septal ring lytic transglycosylase RlpA family protein [Polyangiaceae bacterium]
MTSGSNTCPRHDPLFLGARGSCYDVAVSRLPMMLALSLVLAGCANTTGGAREPDSAHSRAHVERGRASYYSDKLAGHRTASGEPYNPEELTAAHRTLPFGSIVEVSRPSGERVRVRINDRGPFKAGRVIDVSKRAARELDMMRAGVVEVSIRVISVPD